MSKHNLTNEGIALLKSFAQDLKVMSDDDDSTRVDNPYEVEKGLSAATASSLAADYNRSMLPPNERSVGINRVAGPDEPPLVPVRRIDNFESLLRPEPCNVGTSSHPGEFGYDPTGRKVF